MNSAVLLFLSRAALLLLLYLFLFVVVRALRSDLRSATRPQAVPTPAPAPGTSGAMAPVRLGLELVEAGQTRLPPGERFPLHDPLLIGRGTANDIALEDDWISGQHLRLQRQNGSWIAEDLGSTNGTRINGRPLTGAARVRPGDVLDLGRVKFRLVDNI